MSDNTRKEQAKQLAKNVLAFVNIFDFDSETFAETICQDHKALQQSVMQLFIVTIRKIAEMIPDERNKDTVELAKIISTIAEDYAHYL